MLELNNNQKELNVTKKIWADIEGISDMKEIRIDPVGNAVYLYFLLKNNKRGYEVESLINYMNEWIDEIIFKGNISRAIDVEISSAVLGYYSLKKYNKLTKNIQIEQIVTLLTPYYYDRNFFNNFTLTTMICYGLLDIKNNIEYFEELIGWIKENIYAKNVLNDGKNLLFSYLLFENYEDDIITALFEYAYENYDEDKLLFSEEIYHSYILWKNRKLVKDKKSLKRLRKFVTTSLENANDYIKITKDDEVSKIYKGTLMDLVNTFNQTTIKVSKEEVTLDDLSRFVVLAPTIAIMLVLGGTYVGFQLRFGHIDAFILSLINSWGENKTLVAGFHWLIYIIILSIYVISGSLLWDVILKRIVRLEILKNNVMDRLNSKIIRALILSPSILISILEIFFSN